MVAVLPVVVVVGATTLAVQILPYVSNPQDRAQATPTPSSTATSQTTAPSSGASAPDTAKPDKRRSPSPDGAGGSVGETEARVHRTRPTRRMARERQRLGRERRQFGGIGEFRRIRKYVGRWRGHVPGIGHLPLQERRHRPVPHPGLRRRGYRDCADSTAYWAVKSSSGGGFELVNQQTGQCLSANMLGQATFVGDCDQASPRLWRTGSGGTLRSVYNGGCLDVGSGGAGVHTPSCESGKASQRWTKV